MRRLRLVLGLGAAGLAAYLVAGWMRGGEEEPRYITAVVDRGPITATVTATGTVDPVESVQVGTYVSGPIQALFADYNTPVKRGQPLAKIDPRPFSVKVDGARADLANARAAVERNRADAKLKAVTFDRTRNLARQGIVAASELDLAVSEDRQARAQIALAEAAVTSAEARLHEAEVNLAYTDIVSPVDGVVVSRNVDVGQTVAASFQTPTLFLVAADLAKMEVIASVSESDIGGVAPGQVAVFTVDAYPSSTFAGRVEQVRNAPITVLNVVTYQVVLTVDNADLRLKPGMTANVTITTATNPDALRVATTALRFRPPAAANGRAGAAVAAEPTAGPRVWTLDGDGHPKPVPVTTGLQDDRFTEITSGVAEGDRVIVSVHRETPPAVAPANPFMPTAPRRRGP